MDTRSIQFGDDWPDEIRRALEDSQTVLIVIGDGDKWMGVQKYGKRRIDDESDWIRQEVALAIQLNKRVIPVLVGADEQMIPAGVLPDDIKALATKQTALLRRDTWDSDLRSLIEQLRPADQRSNVPLQDMAVQCESVLRDYSQKCVADWERVRPTRFVEPHLAIRKEELKLDRSQIHDAEQSRQDHESLLTDEEKERPGRETAVEQYRRLFEKRPKQTLAARICVTEDAGAGKSVFTHHLRTLLAGAEGQAAIFSGKPGLVARWEGREETWPFDLRQALEDAVASYCPAHDVTAKQVVDYALDQKRICLILDALDQVTDDFTRAGERIRRSELLDRIFRFLNSEPGRSCHVVITGRSYAVTQDSDGWRFSDDTWTFATLEGFTQRQQKLYLGDLLGDRGLTDLIPSYHEVSELLEVPVILSLIAEIAEADHRPREELRLDQFPTRGDVYRGAHEKLAERAVKTLSKANLSARARWESILSAAAFVMMCDQRQRRNYTVTGTQAVVSFRAAVSDWVLAVKDQSIAVTDKDWDELAEFSQLTNHASIESCTGSMLSWKHRGWMEYFAGLYLARYAPKEVAQQVAQFSNDPDWYWAWRFAIEMPDDVANPDKRAAALTNLFHRPADGHRPNELIYRAWSVMEGTSPGRDVLAEFQNEYRALLDEGNPVAAQIEASFRPCPPDPARDSLTFMMGSPDSDKDAYDDEKPQVEMTVEPFEMSDAPTTMQQFWLYDPAHEQDPDFEDRLRMYSPQHDCPVIYVTWYDAWCFARWCGSSLPSEVQWEYACRAGTATRYWWGDKMKKAKCTFETGQTTPASRTHANPWGLMEMSGNVYEWCETWYHEEIETAQQADFSGESRVVRGGSFNLSDPQFLRSAFHYWLTPDYRDLNCGFRLSRTP